MIFEKRGALEKEGLLKKMIFGIRVDLEKQEL